MSCNPGKKEFAYKYSTFKELLRTDSLYYSRGFSDAEKVHKNLIYTIEDRMWFDRVVHPAIREVGKVINRHCPFPDKFGVKDTGHLYKQVQGSTKAMDTTEHAAIYFNLRDDLVKAENYIDLRGGIHDFLRAYFISEWLKDKNTEAYLIAKNDLEEKRATMLSQALNLTKCNKGKGRRGWW
jgi:hypothetical protein